MILGIDVGGTHTDAVLLEGHEICRKAKVRTDEKEILASLLAVTERIIDAKTAPRLQRVVLSTTLATNAIVQNDLDKVGMFVLSGPGLPQSLLPRWEETHFLAGFVNHRGVEVVPVDEREVLQAFTSLKAKGISQAGVVGKFSPRNPRQELMIGNILEGRLEHVSLGHRLCGHLNFPRRIVSTYLNESLWRRNNIFLNNINKFVREKRITAPLYILKADGGTMSLKKSREFPVLTILSGPAASIMGVMTLTESSQDAVALDIGGTTTDIALFAEGVPLLEPYGVTISGYRTLIRGLRSKSIGIGGDSLVTYSQTARKLEIGPKRLGPAAGMGGPAPTPTDAMIVLGMSEIGDRRLAGEALSPIARAMGLSIEEAARSVLSEMCLGIAEAVRQSIREINEEPVYTIHELVEGKQIAPKVLYVVGGPAETLAGELGRLLACRVQIPSHAEVANAIGAALARTTEEITLIADTEQGIMTIGEEGRRLKIPPSFTLAETVRSGEEILKQRIRQMGGHRDDLAIEVVERHEFSMIRQGHLTGKTIRVRLQIKPGIISRNAVGRRL